MENQIEKFFGNCRNISEFEKQNTIGEGTYGVVYSAIDKISKQKVAIKKLKIHDKESGFPITSLREIKSLQQFKGHPNIVELKEVAVGKKLNSIFLVFEYCEKDLANLCEQLYESNQVLQECDIKCFLMQILNAVLFLKQQYHMHRDLKLSNILISEGGIIKLADFGLARNFVQPNINYTDKVVTLWYRAPEILLNFDNYNEKSDVWSIGCIFAELLNRGFSLFPDNLQNIRQIYIILGYPEKSIEEKIIEKNDTEMKEQLKSLEQYKKNDLQNKFNRLSQNGIDLLNQMLKWDQNKRISIEKCLIHPYFYEHPLPSQPKEIKFKFKDDSLSNKRIKF